MRQSRKRLGPTRRALLAAASLLPFPAIRTQAQTAGVALVIGNSRYQWEAPLPNVRRDAPDIARSFQALGLKTELVEDAGRDAMRQALDKYATACRGANFSATYFAGHGAIWNKNGYLVPVDADLSTPHAERLIHMNDFNEATKGAAHRLRAYDNCRNNPADGWRQTEAERQAGVSQAGQQDVARYPNTLSLTSTAPGRVALDGPAGQNSPFAAALLRQLEGQVDLLAFAAKIRRDVLIATQGRQVVFDRSSYQQPFVLNGGRGTAPTIRPDPSKIVELTNAYAYSQENGIPLVPGLIAHRPASSSPDGAKVGSYRYLGQSPTGPTPQVLVVMSVAEQGKAELIVAGKGQRGAFWRFTTGTLSGNRLEFSPSRDSAIRILLDWSDANSGSMAQVNEQSGGNAKAYSSRFSRLDG